MPDWFETFVTFAEITGTVAFAASGAMLAVDRELDMFGVLFLGITAAVGGGILRDLFLGTTPPGAFRNPVYVAVAAATALAVFLFAWRKQRLYRRGYASLDRAAKATPCKGGGRQANEFFVRCACKFRRLAGCKSRNLQVQMKVANPEGSQVAL